MVLRFVSEVDPAWVFPTTVLGKTDTGYVVDVPETYMSWEPLLDEEDNPVYESKTVVADGEKVTQEQVVYDCVVRPVDIDAIGTPATWADITDPMLHKIRIGLVTYAFRPTKGCTTIGVSRDGTLGVITYKRFYANDAALSLRRTISPKFTPLKYERGTLTVNGSCFPDNEFVVATTGKPAKLSDIVLVAPDGSEKQLKFDEVVLEDV